MNWKKSLDTKTLFSNMLKLESNKTKSFKTVAKYLMFENLQDKNSNLMNQRTNNTLDNLEDDIIRRIKMWTDLISL